MQDLLRTAQVDALLTSMLYVYGLELAPLYPRLQRPRSAFSFPFTAASRHWRFGVLQRVERLQHLGLHLEALGHPVDVRPRVAELGSLMRGSSRATIDMRRDDEDL